MSLSLQNRALGLCAALLAATLTSGCEEARYANEHPIGEPLAIGARRVSIGREETGRSVVGGDDPADIALATDDPDERGALHAAVWTAVLLRPELPLAFRGRHPELTDDVRRFATTEAAKLNSTMLHFGSVAVTGGDFRLIFSVSRRAHLLIVKWEADVFEANATYLVDLRELPQAFEPGADLTVEEAQKKLIVRGKAAG